MAKKSNTNSNKINNTSDNLQKEVSIIVIKQFYDKTSDNILRTVDTVFKVEEERADFLIKEGYAKLVEDTSDKDVIVDNDDESNKDVQDINDDDASVDDNPNG